MKPGKVTIRNYRSIPYNNPISLEIKEGITFILGVNNIGKSNILKFFYEFSSLKAQDKQPLINGFTIHSVDGSPISKIVNQKNILRDLEIKLDSDNTYYDLKLHLNHENYSTTNMSGSYTKFGIADGIFDSDDLGLLFQIFSNSLYIGSFRNASFNTTGKYYNIQVGTEFIKTWDIWANGVEIVKRNKISDLVDELKDLFGFDKLEISVNPEKTNLIIKNEEGSFYLDELGGGISHFIIVLGNALIQQPNFILIDEPENALHPKLQQTFVTALASKAKYGLIATSHSIGLARSVADSIYHLTKDNTTKKLSLLDYGASYKPRLLSSINELGYSQFVELGGNNILLVEGRTDIKSIKEILKKYKIEHHFILMDLGGSNFINGESYEELEELLRLNANSYSVIFDSEITAVNQNLKEKFNDFKTNCESLGFNVFPTEVHSTENYINQKAINTILGTQYPVLGKYESLESPERKASNTKWGKSENWKMFKEMTKEDFEGTKLDEFIENVLVPLTK